jgi:hypothetical protein
VPSPVSSSQLCFLRFHGKFLEKRQPEFLLLFLTFNRVYGSLTVFPTQVDLRSQTRKPSSVAASLSA